MLRRSGEALSSLITRADRAREAGQWDIAAQYYRKYLDRNPRNSAIWVQYGHALKESGDLAQAEAAYWRALADEPDVADSHLQLGHVLKLQGKTEEAKAAYLRALLMYDRLSNEPLRELAGLGWSGSEFSERSLANSHNSESCRLLSQRQFTGVIITAADATPPIQEAAEGFTSLGREPDAEMERFRRAVLQLQAEGKPVKLYCGAGYFPRPGFLNLDRVILVPTFMESNPGEYFIFPFADREWALPDDCVDYIFHEDFIEHINQLMQIQFLAETLRVMKPGSWHRVNTPNVITAMKKYSNFKEGYQGVYTGEVKWEHIAIFSPLCLKEMAELVGYREIVFTTRHHGVSPYAEHDFRPLEDRDEIVGNIYADLLK